MFKADKDSWELWADTKIQHPNSSLLELSMTSRRQLPTLRICAWWQRFWKSQVHNWLDKCFSLLTQSTTSYALFSKQTHWSYYMQLLLQSII